MFKNSKNEKLQKTLFVSASIAALLMLFGFYTSLNYYFKIKNMSRVLLVDNKQEQNYYLNEDLVEDPFITRNPQLKNMLNGPIINSVDPYLGKKDAPVNIVYFSDFECDYCADQEKVLSKIIERYSDKIRIIWKDYPDGNKQSFSYQASLAARCAQDQNKFWEYHDLLFKNAEKTGGDLLTTIAKQINLDSVEFEKCLEEERGDSRIKDNILEANALDITGIPFVYVNNQEMMGVFREEDLSKIIDLQLKKDSDG